MEKRIFGVLLMAAAIFVFANAASAMMIFVGNLDRGTTDEELSALFDPYGVVTSAKIMRGNDTNPSFPVYGFVEMPDDEEARAAIHNLDETEVRGRKIIVRDSQPREKTITKTFGGKGFGVESKPATTPTTAAPKEKTLDKTQSDDLVSEVTDWLSDLTDDDDAIEAITAKWDAHDDLAGKTRTQILNLLLVDAKTVIKDKATLDAFVKGWNANASQIVKP